MPKVKKIPVKIYLRAETAAKVVAVATVNRVRKGKVVEVILEDVLKDLVIPEHLRKIVPEEEIEIPDAPAPEPAPEWTEADLKEFEEMADEVG